MMNFNNGPSLADIAAVTRDNNSFLGNNGIWAIIILFAIFGGWGNGAMWGGCGGNSSPASQADVRAAVDQQTLISKIDGQTYGIADLGYALTNQFSQAELSRANQQAALIAQMTANATANQQNFSNVQYGMATNTAAITNAIRDAVQSIKDNDNANYRALHDENVAAAMAAKDNKIAELTALLNNANLKASQADQTNYIVNELKQCPKPAYIVANPYASSCCQGCCAA